VLPTKAAVTELFNQSTKTLLMHDYITLTQKHSHRKS